MAQGSLVEEVYQKLQQAGKAAIAWGHQNKVWFDLDKTKAVLFSRKKGRSLKEIV